MREMYSPTVQMARNTIESLLGRWNATTYLDVSFERVRRMVCVGKGLVVQLQKFGGLFEVLPNAKIVVSRRRGAPNPQE